MPLTPPSAVSLRVNAERIVLLGWVRAILLQLAHPLIAAGVAEHSTFRSGASAAFSRLHQTVGAMLALTFGDDGRREEALEAIRVIHRRVHGTLPAACGPFHVGTPYSAEDPPLLLWVHATLIDSIVRIYEQIVGPMSEAERDAYCADSAEVAIALGARADEVPRSWRALQAYMAAQYGSGAIAPCHQARELAAALLAPLRGLAATPLNGTLTLIAAGLLPPDIRRAYGLEWNRRRERSFRGMMAALHLARHVTPRLIRWWPDARRAP